MTRRVLALFAVAFVIALSALWFVHRRSVERSLELVRSEQVKESLQQSRLVARTAFGACGDDRACEQRIHSYVARVERSLLALEELELLHDELAVTLALYGLGPFALLFIVCYAALVAWTRRLFVPLRGLADGALRYAKGEEANFPVPERGPEDVRALAVALNRMLETIRRQSSTLASQARSLGWQEIAREVVHESRNLLTPLKLGAEGLVERAINESDEALARDGKQLMAGLGALERMTASLKDLSAHRFPKMEIIDIGPVLQAVAEIHGGRAADIAIEADTGCVVVGDGDLLGEALGNMVTNALEAGARRIVLSARRDERNVAIACADDGRGIAPENLARVAMLGFSTKPSGSGFGLYFANKLAKQLDGRVEIESKPGRGTRVRMVLRHAHDTHNR